MRISEIELTKVLEKHAAVFDLQERDIYRVYTVAKSGGKTRTICEPCEKLKALQLDLLPLIKRLPVSRAATAYERHSSIMQNAQKHLKGRHILHADIKDFFPSVSRKMFDRYFSAGLSYRLADKLWRAVSFDGGLAVGAPTSPFIANRVMLDVDKKLAKTGLFIRYTRYADDLVFSSPFRINEKILDKIKPALKAENLTLNQKKTYFMSGSKKVTGLSLVDRRRITVGTNYKKKLKSDIYLYLTKGKGDPQKLAGRFGYLKAVEPAYAETVRQKYKPFDKSGFF